MPINYFQEKVGIKQNIIINLTIQLDAFPNLFLIHKFKIILI